MKPYTVLGLLVVCGLAGCLEANDASDTIQAEAEGSTRLLQNWEAVKPSTSRRLLTDTGSGSSVTVIIKKKSAPTPSPPPPSVIIIKSSSPSSPSPSSKVVKVVSAPSPPPPSKSIFTKFPFLP
ncbi:hypothetical protein WJX75_007447 [Coccomyxa subellipsoidea]|uniref:Uncharacterized protein n=1 Tax=Coccomyxa subellipsoidea TaxID=248742 RepID=A0ABR2YQJ0_9CHLO